MWSEKKQQPQEPSAEGQPKESVTSAAILKKLGLGEEALKPSSESKTITIPKIFGTLQRKIFKEQPQVMQQPSLPPINSPTPSTGTAALRLDTRSFSDKNSVETESDLALRHDELEKKHSELIEKYQKLDALFQEKSQDLEKSEKALSNEVKHRKDFNKVKDLLEKELKDSKDKCRELEVQLTAAQTEGNSYLKRVNQLEENIKTLEKNILAKEEEIKEAQGQIQLRQKKIGELEEKIQGQEKLIQEKNLKINAVVDQLKKDGHVSPENELQPKNTEPETPTQTEPVINEEPPAPAAIPAVADSPSNSVAEVVLSPESSEPPPQPSDTTKTEDHPAMTEEEAPKTPETTGPDHRPQESAAIKSPAEPPGESALRKEALPQDSEESPLPTEIMPPTLAKPELIENKEPLPAPPAKTTAGEEAAPKTDNSPQESPPVFSEVIVDDPAQKSGQEDPGEPVTVSLAPDILAEDPKPNTDTGPENAQAENPQHAEKTEKAPEKGDADQKQEIPDNTSKANEVPDDPENKKDA